MDDLLSEFIAETRETLEALAGEVVAWEASPDDRERLDSIFRFVHTVKGSCGFLDLPRLERLSHSAEDALAHVRAGERVPDQALVSAVLGIIDRIGELTEAIASGDIIPDFDDEALILALEPCSKPNPNDISVPAPQVYVPRAPARTIRLPLELLDRMMGGVSDMVLARNELARRLRGIPADSGIDTAFERLSGCVAEMRESITRTRMQRVDKLFAILPRMVRDLSAELEKSVSVEIEGGDVELDREMLEMIRDPLTHIIRNAIDHGIELPEARRAAGKPSVGRLRVMARQSGNQILLEIADDGRGIDGDLLVRKAIAAGILTEDRALLMSPQAKLALIFEAGLSTAKAVTPISGRGVGMDVVRANIERIGGLVDIDSRPGQGLRLTIRVPLTLTIIPALTLSASGQHFAIPRAAIEEIVRVDGNKVRIEAIGGTIVARVRGRRLPVVNLAMIMGIGVSDARILVVLRPAGSPAFALAVDSVHDHEELVVKPAAPAVMATGLYAGTTLPDTGHPMLLLDPAGLAEAGGVTSNLGLVLAEEVPEEAISAPTVQTLLFLDLDGRERAIRLSLVERIEDVAADAITHSAGRLRLAHQGRLIPLEAIAPLGDRAAVRVLRMSDGASEVAYAIERVIDIASLPELLVLAQTPGPISGVALVDGRQIELIDPHWLFAQHARPGISPVGERPLCLLRDGADPWVREILRPLVEAAGYRVAMGGEIEESVADVVIAGEGAALAVGSAAPMVRLRADPAASGDGSIYRYDRAALFAALEASGGRR